MKDFCFLIRFNLISKKTFLLMTSLETLPAGWKISDIRRPHFRMVRLGWNRVHWFCLAELPEDETLEELLQLLRSRSPRGFVIRGCNADLAEKLNGYKFQKVFIGKEAVLDLQAAHFEKKSLRELVRRGQRKGTVREIPFSPFAQARINELRQASPHGTKLQLRHLFRTTFEDDDRCFVFEMPDKTWKAAITLSRSASNTIQTELLVRHRTAAPGSMETLIAHIFFELKKEGFRYWSLGEVPFTNPPRRQQHVKDRVVFWVGKLFNYAYNARGLYHFKNKFSPLWKDVYLCGYPHVSFYSLWGLFQKSNFSRLAVQTIPKNWVLSG